MKPPILLWPVGIWGSQKFWGSQPVYLPFPQTLSVLILEHKILKRIQIWHTFSLVNVGPYLEVQPDVASIGKFIYLVTVGTCHLFVIKFLLF